MKQILNQMNAYYMLLMLNSMAGHIDCIYIHSLCLHLLMQQRCVRKLTLDGMQGWVLFVFFSEFLVPYMDGGPM